jgi:hypothetical protein
MDDIRPPSADAVPLVIITSNKERDLSPAFMRRCVKLDLQPPDADQLLAIAEGHLPPGEESTRAIAAAASVMQPPGITAAAFVDAARVARAFGLDEQSPELVRIRQLLLADSDAATAEDA